MSFSGVQLSACFFVLLMVAVIVPAQNFGQDKFLRVGSDKIENRYIVVLHPSESSVESIAKELTDAHGGKVGFIYDRALFGFAIEASERVAIELSSDSRVKYVTEDSEVTLEDTQPDAPWNLDRIDQRDLPLSTTFTYSNLGQGVFIYVIDSGIQPFHYEFTNYPSSSPRIMSGADFVGGSGNDCNGHGTHVAGIAAGNEYGVAKRAFVVSVRVFPCTQNTAVSTVVAGVNWVKNHRQTYNINKSVVNLSFSGSPNQAIDDAVRDLISSGVMCVVAAGNDNTDANNVSPARVREGLTIGNTNINDFRDSLSNYGTAVDVFAPGENIIAAGLNNTLDTRSGTSMSAPHVAGTIALLLASTSFAYSPREIQNYIVANASWGKILSPGVGSPNALLYHGTYTYGGSLLPFYRHANASLNGNIYVMGWDELGAGKNGYVLQEIEGYVSPVTDNFTLGPLYRYRNDLLGDYFYTMDFSELGSGANGYVFEKIEGYLRFGPGSNFVPLYRYWNPTISKHYYTSDFTELGNGANGYVYQGITGYLAVG